MDIVDSKDATPKAVIVKFNSLGALKNVPRNATSVPIAKLNTTKARMVIQKSFREVRPVESSMLPKNDSIYFIVCSPFYCYVIITV